MKASKILYAVIGSGLALGALAFIWSAHRGSVKHDLHSEPPGEDAQEASGTEYLDSVEYFTAERAYPGTDIDWSMYDRAAAQLRATPSGPPPATRWAYLGPNNLASPTNPNNRFQGPSQLAGRLNCVAYGPNTQFGQLIYCGSSTGGFYQGIYERSGSWVELSDATWPTYAVSCCAISPTGADIIVGTGDFEGVLPNPPGCKGLMESFDGGATWANVAAPFVPPGAAPTVPMISRVVMDPDTFDDDNHVGTVIATSGRSSGSNGGIDGAPNRNYTTLGNLRISTDQGRTWRIAPGTPGAAAGVADAVWNACAISPRSLTTGLRYYYAVAWIPGTGASVWRSDDSGKTWHRTALNPFVNGAQESIDIACSPNLSDNVYVLSGGGTTFGGYGDRTVMSSTNGGNTWTNITGNIPADGGVGPGGAGYDWNQSYYDYTIAVTSQPPAGGKPPNDVVFVGLIDVASAVQDGPNNAKWSWQGKSYDIAGNPHLTHSDDHSLAFNPSVPSQGLFGNDGGAYGITGAGLGACTFTPFNQKLHIEEFYNMSFLPDAPGKQSYYTGGCQDIAAPFFSNGAAGPTSTWGNAVQIGDGGYSVITPGTPATQFQGGTFRRGSVNAMGVVTRSSFTCFNTTNTWGTNPANSISTYLPPPPGPAQPFEVGAFIPPMIQNPANGRLLLGTNHLWQWTPGGANGKWALYNGDNKQLTKFAGDYVRSIATSKDGRYFYTGSLGGAVWVNLPNGTWVEIDRQGMANGLPNRTVTGIAADPNNVKRIWVTLSGPSGAGRVFVCNDTTAAAPKWANVSGDILDVPACCIAVNPKNSNHLEVGTDMGVYTSLNGGTTWTNYTAPYGLPVVSVRAIDFKVISGVNYISIATFGRGAWQYAYGSPVP